MISSSWLPSSPPYRDMRAQIRQSIQPFVEIYVKCSLEECARRDVKGLYRKAFFWRDSAFYRPDCSL
ncbi:adenylyl-sulfate kinase [Paenibacillus rhizoplanae]